MTNKDYQTDPELTWWYPHEHTPPKDTKIFLLTFGGIALVGRWGADCVAWRPLFKRDKDKEKSLNLNS